MEQGHHPEQPSAWHTLDPDEVWQRLDSSERGLSAAEALRRLAAQGSNSLPAARRPSVLRRLLGQFHNLPQEIWDAHRRVAAEVEAAVEARQ